MANSILEKIEAGESKILIGLYAFGQCKEEILCDTIGEAKKLLHKQMAAGWAYRLEYTQFAYDDHGNDLDRYRPEVAEVERAMGIVPMAEIL